MNFKLLIIDDEENMRHMLQALLSRSGYEVHVAKDGLEGLAAVQSDTFHFVLCDVRMPALSGMEFLERAEPYLADTTVIMMSAYGTVDLALEAMKKGAYDYISKPFKSDEVLLTLRKAEEREALRTENVRLKKELEYLKPEDGFGAMLGSSGEMVDLFNMARKIAAYTTTVLITGESGTGKELLARGIHLASPRKDKEFLAVNCGSIPEHLLESELFGYVKGAFTGADKDRRGIFVEADGGTLFLDEIGELLLNMQVKILRVLQEGEVKPIGANHPLKVDVRILAATSRDVAEAVRLGRFREDLLYRLNVLHLHIPPLRSRKNDIPHLCAHFIKKVNSKAGRKVDEISMPAMQILMHHAWPGNVRELENVIERAVILAESRSIMPADLPESVRQVHEAGEELEDSEESLSIKTATARIEARMIRRAMQKTAGNKSRAAELLEMSYPSLLAKIKKYGIGE